MEALSFSLEKNVYFEASSHELLIEKLVGRIFGPLTLNSF